MKKHRVNLVLLALVGLMGYSMMARADEEETNSPLVTIMETLNAMLQTQNELVQTQNALLKTQNALTAKMSDISETQDAMLETIQRVWRSLGSTGSTHRPHTSATAEKHLCTLGWDSLE